MNICYIPTKNKSERLKDKNNSQYGNGTLITHTVEQAIESDLFDRIILSSNDHKILNSLGKYNIETVFVPNKFKQIIDVIKYLLPKMNVGLKDIVGLLLVTCPLRQVSDIISAYDLFKENDCYHTVVSIKKNENPIQLSFKVDLGGHLEPVFPDSFNRSTRKQDHDDTFYFNDAVIFDTCERFMQPERNLFGDNMIPYLMPWERSIAIDHNFQLELCRRMEESNVKI